MSSENYKNQKYITLAEAAIGSPYSQEYLSLLARKGKLFSKKIGRNWYTTREALSDYLTKQGLNIIIPKDRINFLHQGKLSRPMIVGAEALFHTKKDEEKELGEQHEARSKLLEEFEKLNVQLPEVKTETPTVQQKIEAPKITPPPSPVKNLSDLSRISPMQLNAIAGKSESVSSVTQRPATSEISGKLDKTLSQISENLAVLSRIQKVYMEKQITPPVPSLIQPIVRELSEEQKEFYEIESHSLSHKIRRLNYFGNHAFNNSKKAIGIVIAALVLLFLIGGGFSFGNADAVAIRVKDFFKNADTIQGHFAGTHANEVLLLDKDGKISIFGHIETQSQFRSFAPDGVAPIVVDSKTLVENLNAEYLDGLASKDFTLAFVTKNGNITYDDVYLEGSVEVGKTLKVKGATKLLDSLSVYGRLGVFSDAVFGKDVQLTGGDLRIDKGSVNLAVGNLSLGSGTIEINNPAMIKNLNAELLQSYRPSDFNLDFVVGNGDQTDKTAFFNGGLYGGDGGFSSLGVAGDLAVGTEGQNKNAVTIFSKKFSVDNSGNLTVSGTVAGNKLSVDNVISNLIPSGSYDLGSTAKPWDELIVASASIGNLILTGSVGLSGTTSSSFTINTDNTSSDSEDAYLAFERGAITPNAALKWNSTNKRFEFNEPVFVSSASATTFSVSGGSASISNSLYVQNAGNVGIGNASPDSKLDITGNILASTSGNIDLTLNSTTNQDSKFTLRNVGASARLDILGSASQAFVTVASSGNVGIGTTAPAFLLHVYSSPTQISGDLKVNRTQNFANPPATSTARYWGIQGEAEVLAGNTQNLTGDPLTALQGVEGSTKHFGTGVVTSADGVRGYIENGSTGIIASASAIHAAYATNLAGGSITKNFGLLIDNQTAGINNWAIKTGSGLVDFGDSASVALNFELTGTGYASASYFYAQPGTAALPAFSFGNDTNTGIFRKAADSLSLSTGGLERLNLTSTTASISNAIYVDSSNRVGIGTTGPTANLYVKNGTNVDSTGQPAGTFAAIIYNAINSTGQNGLLIKNNWENSASTPLEIGQDFVGGAYRSLFKVDGGGNVIMGTIAGNVGIGNASPDSKLDITGNILASTSGNIDLTLNSTTNQDSKFTLRNVGASARLDILGSASQAFVTVASSGNVGIGTTAPTKFVTIASTSSDGNVLRLQDSNGTCDHNPGAGSEVVTCSSDARLKTNIHEAAPELAYLTGIPIKDYNLKVDGSAWTGPIAQELLDKYPELVTLDNSDGYYKVSGITSWKIIKGIQELDAKIASLSVKFDGGGMVISGSASQQFGGLIDVTASASGNVVISHASGFDTLTLKAIKQIIFDAPIAVFNTVRAKSDIIAEGIRRTYFKAADLFANYDLTAMVGNWTSRSIEISQEADLQTMSLLSGNGAQAAEQSKTDLAENGNYLATYGVDSTRGEIQLSGSSDLVSGEAKVYFDYSFTALISGVAPIRVIVTPTTNTIRGQLYVSDKTPYGFVVKELNGLSSGKFDWLAIARRKGFDTDINDISIIAASASFSPTPSPSPTTATNTILTASPSSSSPLASSSPTPLPSESPMPTPLESTTASGSLTLTGQAPSPSDSPTSTPTPIVSETPTPTPIPSDSPTLTPSPPDTPTPTPSPSDSPTLLPTDTAAP